MNKYAIAVLSVAFAMPAGASEGAFGTLLTAAAVEKSADLPEIPEPKMPERGKYTGLLDLDAGRAAILASEAAEDGYAVFMLDGSRMTTKEALMSQMAVGLRLPGVPGNWDALGDYMSELSSLHNTKRLLIVLRNASAIAAANPQLYADLREMAGFVCASTREWSQNSVRLTFVFAG